MPEEVIQDIESPEFQMRMGRLMAKATESPEGLRALAAIIAPPIEQRIKTKEISSLFLKTHNLPPAERATYQKKGTGVRAYWFAAGGTAVRSEIDNSEVDVPIHRIHTNPMVDITKLTHGNLGTLTDIQKDSADEIRKEMDKRTLATVIASVPTENIVVESSANLTEDSLNAVIALMEDKELSPKLMTMRGSRFNDIRALAGEHQDGFAMKQKGISYMWAGTDILLTSALSDARKIIVIPDDEIGKMPVRTKLTVKPIDEPKEFETGWLIYQEVGHVVLRPDLVFMIDIQG